MGKENYKQQASVLLWVLIASGLLSQNLAVPVMAATTTFEDQKNYYSPDPHSSGPPAGHRSPSHGSPSPSHGSGGGTPTHNTPSTPSHGNCGSPSTPSNPPSGGGGYYPTPPTYGGNPPSEPTPSAPTPTPTTPYVPTPSTPTPTTPYVPTPSTPTPTTPYVPTPSTPSTPPSVPSPPFVPDPNSPFTCIYWKNHPGLVWGILGWWGTLGNAFGVTSLPGFGASMSVQQAISNTRTDGYGTLYREGTASLLNSMVINRFPFTTRQVRESFVSALSSNKAANAQGKIFKMANEGKLKPRT